jgi:putative ABC transport system permease protein
MELGVLSLYGLEPVAGQLPSGDIGAAGYVINETAARRLGFTSPAAALGQSLPFQDTTPTGTILAVVPDFSIDAVDEPLRPAIFAQPGATRDPITEGRQQNYHLFSVKLRGQEIPQTLAAIDALWTRTGHTQPIDRFFLDSYVQDLYLSVLRQAQSFAVCAAVAVLLACLGLAGLSAAMANRRSKEIGIRKAMGAEARDIVRLLLWQFTQPVLWGALLAWAASSLVMGRWLHGFAYHVSLDPMLFVGAAAAALALSWAAVAAHCFTLARANPVLALRYE